MSRHNLDLINQKNQRKTTTPPNAGMHLHASQRGDDHATLKDAAHIITNSHRFEGSGEVEAGVNVVTDQWVDRSLVLGRMQQPQLYSSDLTMIFSGVVACAAELPTSDLEVLSAGITALGGQWRTGLTKDVTHLFAITPNSQKYATALHFQELTNRAIFLSRAIRLFAGWRDAVEVGIQRCGGEFVRYAADDEEGEEDPDEEVQEQQEWEMDRKDADTLKGCDILVTRWRSGWPYVRAKTCPVSKRLLLHRNMQKVFDIVQMRSSLKTLCSGGMWNTLNHFRFTASLISISTVIQYKELPTFADLGLSTIIEDAVVYS
ncbi:hypothetical protein K443DRAFT_125763 [Laccaria amethystina LaAM-08-1]|uniref:Unplaced genomic scaffold K443scaffold_338, whole genome shotgun sequence n=1 Tax=Laccaria amethystina LaAM-08-1 TaxID=1095629 RepID=A0A0C9WW16_9AGAR|nr:hypothetical protein K443DRAFT_125763 [Laccaria amethystina LaAM-08-1]